MIFLSSNNTSYKSIEKKKMIPISKLTYILVNTSYIPIPYDVFVFKNIKKGNFL